MTIKAEVKTMALKNLFDMVKADRYTADGREAIIKAQEAETEDAKEKPEGAVSPDGKRIKQGGKWVPRKNAKQPGKTDKPNPNGVVAQQKQKLEAEKYEAARRDAQAPSKKTEVNFPGLRKDVQEAIKRSSPEEIKAYIKELRTPGSRMSRYFDNPDLLANVYEDELNKMTESKPALSQTDGKGNKVEIKITESKGGGFYVDKYVNGKKVGINNANTRESAEAKAKSMMEQHMADPDYRAESKPAAPRREAVSAGRMMKDLDGNFWSRPEDFKEDITSRGWDVDEMTNEYAVISNEAGSQYEVRFDDHSDDGDLTVRTFKALQIDEDDEDDSLEEDAAPKIRQLTGDCKIRVRKA